MIARRQQYDYIISSVSPSSLPLFSPFLPLSTTNCVFSCVLIVMSDTKTSVDNEPRIGGELLATALENYNYTRVAQTVFAMALNGLHNSNLYSLTKVLTFYQDPEQSFIELIFLLNI